MKTTRSNSRRVAYYALISLLLTLVPGTANARAVAAAGHASKDIVPLTAPANATDPFYRGATDAGSIWTLKQGEITAIARGRTNTGVSVFNEAGYLAGTLNRFPCIYLLIRGEVPLSLRVQQRGLNLNHFELMPNHAMTVGGYSQTLTYIPLFRVKGAGNPLC